MFASKNHQSVEGCECRIRTNQSGFLYICGIISAMNTIKLAPRFEATLAAIAAHRVTPVEPAFLDTSSLPRSPAAIYKPSKQDLTDGELVYLPNGRFA